jgi:hypothetical protein
MVTLVRTRAISVLVALAWMMTTAATVRVLLVRRNRTLCLGGTKVPSKRHLSLSDRFSARPIPVLRRMGHAGSAYYRGRSTMP